MFLTGLGHEGGIPLTDINSVLHHATAHQHGPADFPYDREPLEVRDWPHWKAPINRDRLYDFYAKEADYFRGVAASGTPVPTLLKEFPGLDGGTLGHWATTMRRRGLAVLGMTPNWAPCRPIFSAAPA